MQVLVTLSGLIGNGLGPNFTINSNAGGVSPNVATKDELLAGKPFVVPDGATQLVVTSTGACTNSITLNIIGIP